MSLLKKKNKVEILRFQDIALQMQAFPHPGVEVRHFGVTSSS